MKDEIAKEKIYGDFTYRITIDENIVSPGDYIFDFVTFSTGRDPIIRCNNERFAELINKDHKKPMVYRRSAKIIASNDPVLNIQGVPEL